jgi:DNA mismatch repair protein MutL
MSQIQILPELISNKIAAGEVVERPASVVKELVENALDAGSSRILIGVENGGRSLIRVSDNGSGMSQDDALLSLERYATSKIRSDADLFAIRSFGFRGEALPSIAAVSRLHLVTRRADADAGTELRVQGGKITAVAEVGAPPGTQVTAARLFYNTPARRKFMKSVTTEMGHIAETVASIALGNPAVQFRLAHNGKTVKSWPATADPIDRVADVLGRGMHARLLAVNGAAEGVAVSGWIAPPADARRTSRSVFVYVNGRFVRDRTVQHALFAGFRQRLVKGQFPVAVLKIAVPFEEVDVNVHPTKHEVRFARQRQVHDTVCAAVAAALDRHDRPPWGGAAVADEPGSGSRWGVAEHLATTAYGTGAKRRVPAAARPGDSDARAFAPPTDPAPPPSEAVAATHRTAPTGSQAPEPAPIFKSGSAEDLRVIGQFRNTYILCECAAGLVLIDQHAAHERIYYEQLTARARTAPGSHTQRLLVPETLELGYREAGILEGILADLERLGLVVEPFGHNTFVVKAVPALLAGREIRPLILAIVERLADTGIVAELDAHLDECLKLMACHAAIRARQRLTDEQLRSLPAQLLACENPSHCPHGRPTWIQWSLRELEKAFGRVI